ncbi:MAG: tetratricopeptide repeat protein, partial [Acidobacteriota bacterium]
YREGRPVSARQGQLSYVASKFIRRHWIPIATALLFTALIAAFAVSTAVQANRNARTLGRLVAVERFLADLFGAVSPEIAKGRQIPVDEVLQRGERQLDLGLIREAGSRGLLHALFGRIALHLGDLTQARDHLERALEAYQEVTNDPYIGLAEIRARGDLALVTLYHGRDAAEAETLAREALALGRDHPQLDRPALLRLLNTVTMIYCLQGNWAEARPLADEAYALSTAAGAPPSLQAAAALSLRALLEKNQDQKPEEASRLYARSLTIYRQLEGDTHPDIAAVLNQLGLLATARGDTASATRHLGEALEVRQRLYPQGHWEIGQSLYQLGIVHRRSADLNRAEELLHEAWQVYVRERGPEYGRTIFMWLHLADVRFALGRAQETEAMLEELTPAWWASRKPTSRLLPLARRVLGCTLGALGRLAEAEDLLQLSLDALQDQQGPEAWETRAARACLDDVRARRQETVDE